MRTIDLLSDFSERVPYTMPGYPFFVTSALLSRYRDMGTPSHWHDDLEFGIIQSGSMTYTVNGECFQLERGQGIFINARQLHSNYTEDGGDCEYVCVLIHPSLLCANRHLEETFIAPLLQNSRLPYRVLHPDVAWHARLMDTIGSIQACCAGAEDALPCLSIQRLAFQAASCLFENMPADPPGAAHIDRRLATLRSMTGFVQLHYEERITLGDIARAGSVSESTCCDIFRQRLRQTPIGYLTRYRIEKGMELLEKPDLPIVDVAMAVGFSSASYFTETFRRIHGLTPSAYRRAKRRTG